MHPANSTHIIPSSFYNDYNMYSYPTQNAHDTQQHNEVLPLANRPETVKK